MTADELKEEGLRLFRRGTYDQALAAFETAVQTYEQEGNEVGQAEMLNNMGVIHRLRGDYNQSLAAFTGAEAIFTRLGDHNRQAQAWGNLGDLYAAQRDRVKAAQYYSDAAELFAQDGDRLKQSQVLRALSLMRLRQGRGVEAMMRMEESLSAHPHPGPLQLLFRAMLRFALKLFGAR